MRQFIFSLILFLFAAAQAEILKIQIEGKPKKLDFEIVAQRDANGRFCAGIKVISDMDGFSYDAYNGVVKLDDKPGEDLVYLQPDERVLEIYHSGYEPLKIILYEAGISLNPREVWVIHISGDAQTLPVSIITEPADAQILFDGTEIGRGPSFKLPTGKHSIKISHPDYEPQEAQITINEDHTLFRYHLKKRESAILSITSDPSGAEVYLDGKLLGATPYDGMVLSGKYVVEARKNLYLTTRKEVMVKAAETTKEHIRLTPNFGYLRVTSQPSGAQVFMENRLVGTTPFTSTALDKGSYKLRLSKNLYYSKERMVQVDIDATTTEHFNLKQAFGGISLYSNPAGADVFINNKKVGVTPYKDPQLASGTYLLSLKKELYLEVNKRITVTDGKLYEETIELPANFGIVTIKTPADARVTLDGKNIKGGISKYRLKSGMHTFAAGKAKHNPAKESINVMAGENRTLELYPEARSGIAAIFVSTKEARDARITIDGKDYGTAPKIIKDLLEGEHVMELNKPGYLPYKRKINIVYNREQRFTAEMVTYAGSLQAEKDSWGRKRNWTVFGAAIFAGAGGYFKYMADKRFDDYEKAVLTKDADAAQTDVENYDKYTQGALIGAGVFVVWALYNQIRKSAVKMPKERVSLNYNPQRQQLAVQVYF